MPDGPADIERLAATLEVLTSQLAAARVTLDGLRLGVVTAAPAAVPRPVAVLPPAASPSPSGRAPRPAGSAAVPAPAVDEARTPHAAGAWVTPLPTARRGAVPGAGPVPAGTMTTPTTVPRSQVASLAGVPLLSAGLVEAVIGPIATLDELDAVEAHIARFHGVSTVTVRRLERSDALLLVELAQPTPLADMLREDLGRPVASCRLAEGRIVVEFAPE
jgi:hypothetical protein